MYEIDVYRALVTMGVPPMTALSVARRLAVLGVAVR